MRLVRYYRISGRLWNYHRPAHLDACFHVKYEVLTLYVASHMLLRDAPSWSSVGLNVKSGQMTVDSDDHPSLNIYLQCKLMLVIARLYITSKIPVRWPGRVFFSRGLLLVS